MNPLDPLVEAVAARVVELLRPELATLRAATPDAAAPLLMRRKEYARRVGYSVRALDARLPSDAYAGAGRLRRVLVAKADAALVGTGHREPMAKCDKCGTVAPASLPACPRCGEPTEDEGDEVERLARSTARKGTR
jgi:hypothetical protein